MTNSVVPIRNKGVHGEGLVVMPGLSSQFTNSKGTGYHSRMNNLGTFRCSEAIKVQTYPVVLIRLGEIFAGSEPAD